MKPLSLYELSSNVEQMLNNDELYDPETGELMPGLVEALSDTREKAVSVAAFILNRDAEIAAIEEHINKVEARKKHLVSRQERLREYLAVSMKRTGITELTANDSTFSAKLYIERDASVEIYDERQIPADFWKAPKPPEPKPSKAEIMKALKADVDVPGAKIVKKDRLELK